MIGRPTLRACTLVICSLLLASCGVPFVGALTPEQAARQSALGPNGQPTPIQIAGQRQLPNNRVIVLYRAQDTMPDGQPMDLFGYSEVERQGLGWSSRGGGASGGPPRPATDLVNMSHGGGSNERGNHALVYGETLVPDVLAVEATFDNGETLRDSAADGVFVVYSDNSNAVCSMKLLGANDVVLRTDILNAPPLPGQPPMGMPNNCPKPEQ